MKPMTQEEIDQWNAGARLADAHWADVPSTSLTSQPEFSPDGRLIGSEYPKGYFDRRKESK